MPTAFSSSLTQCFLSLPHQLSDKCETEQGGVEEKYKQRLLAAPPAPPIISNSFSYYENKSPNLKLHQSFCVFSTHTETQTHVSTPDPHPTPPNLK